MLLSKFPDQKSSVGFSYSPEVKRCRELLKDLAHDFRLSDRAFSRPVVNAQEQMGYLFCVNDLLKINEYLCFDLSDDFGFPSKNRLICFDQFREGQYLSKLDQQFAKKTKTFIALDKIVSEYFWKIQTLCRGGSDPYQSKAFSNEKWHFRHQIHELSLCADCGDLFVATDPDEFWVLEQNHLWLSCRIHKMFPSSSGRLKICFKDMSWTPSSIGFQLLPTSVNI